MRSCWKVAALVLVGFLTSGMIAWVLALHGPISAMNSNKPDEFALGNTLTSLLTVHARKSIGKRELIYVWSAQHADSDLPTNSSPLTSGSWGISTHGLRRLADSSRSGSRIERAYGWPQPVFWFAEEDTARGIRTIGGIRLPTWANRFMATSWGPTGLPYYPVWVGLMVDTAFFGIVWALVVGVFLRLRNRRRIRLGRCANCSYDLSGLPVAACPECGWKSER